MTERILPGFLLYLLCFNNEKVNCEVSKIDDNSFTNGTELVFAFIVHRHGDKTPEESLMNYAVNKEALDKYIRFWGYGELTNIGRRRSYKLGQFIRRRFNKLISPVYNDSQMYIRTTDVGRVKLSSLTAMAAVYPAVGNTWSRQINWVPVPYTTVPNKYDFNLAILNCPVYITAFKQISSTPTDNRHCNMLTKISKVLNKTISNTPGDIYALYDVIECEIGLGIDLGPEIEEVLPELQKATNEAIDTMFENVDNYNSLGSGVLLQQFFESASGLIDGKETYTVKIYSGHDFNVYAFEAVTRVTPKQGVPKFGALFALELRRIIGTGEYVVLPVYLPSPEENAIYLSVEGCGFPCKYSKFYNITSKYILTENEWRKKCHFNNDIVIDPKKI